MEIEMDPIQEDCNQKEYFDKANKYYLFDDYRQLINWIDNNVKLDHRLILPLFPLENAFVRRRKNDVALAAAIQSLILKNKRFFSSKKAQWKLFLQLKCKPQLLPNTQRYFREYIKLDFSKDFNFVVKNIGYNSINGLDLSLKFLDSNYFRAQTPRFKKQITARFAQKWLNEDLKWNLIPIFIKQEASFLIQISYHAVVYLEENEFEEYKNLIVGAKFNLDLHFLSQLKDDGYLAIILAPEELKKSYKFWLKVATQYESYDREAALDQFDYEDYFWAFVPQEVKCNIFFIKDLKRIIPHFVIP
jgi:hypothetical protein